MNCAPVQQGIYCLQRSTCA